MFWRHRVKLKNTHLVVTRLKTVDLNIEELDECHEIEMGGQPNLSMRTDIRL